MVEELRTMVGTDETVLYEGKPNLSCFIFESIFNPLLPVAVVWALFDFNFLKNAMGLLDVGTAAFTLDFLGEATSNPLAQSISSRTSSKGRSCK